jgi:Lipocalin-like domain
MLRPFIKHVKTLHTILISLAISSFAFGGADTSKVVGEWQCTNPSTREPIATTYTFKADGTYESVMVFSKGTLFPVRQKGTYTVAGDTISFTVAGSTTKVPYAFDGAVLVFPESPGNRFKRKE